MSNLFRNFGVIYRIPRPLLSILIATVTSFVLMGLLSWFSYNLLREMSLRTERVNKSFVIRLRNKDLIKLLTDIETGQRGFLLTNRKHFLQPYFSGKVMLNTIQEELNMYVEANTLQHMYMDSINSLIGRRMAKIEYHIARKINGLDLDIEAMEIGKAQMDSLRLLSQRFSDAESQSYENDLKFQKEADRRIMYYLSALSITFFIFLIFFFRLHYIELKQRIEAQSKLIEKNHELETANVDLEQFAYITSHDLQEPLRKIRAFGERIVTKYGSELNPDATNNLQKISQAATRMQALIQDLLVFSRAGNSKDAFFGEVDLNKIVEEVKEDLQQMIQDKQAIISHEPLPTIMGIETQLRQLFINLINNSIKYSKADVSPNIEIKYQKVDRNVTLLSNINTLSVFYHQITFVDNGIGFDEQYAEKIFEIFQRLHNRSEYAGTGIGLALCKRIVLNHKGYIMAQPRTDSVGGAIFSVYLPTA